MRYRWQVLGGLAAVVSLMFMGCNDDALAQEERRAPLTDRFLDQFNTDGLLIPATELRRGGPPKEGIPAITDPDVVSAMDAGFLQPTDRVIGVHVDGESRAYPIRLLNWHEIVNDTLGGTPIAVLYCPLCDSASVVERRVDGEVLEFGVSGLLYESNVVMYDRTHDALWTQVGLEALSGPMAGQVPNHLPFELVSFAEWRRANPGSTVASFDTGHRRGYDRNPYEAYFQHDELMFPVSAEEDPRLPRKEPVMGIKIGDQARAYPVERVAESSDGRVEEEIGGHRVVLEAADNGQIRVVEAPENARLVHTFWFTWAAFHPGTTIYEEGDRHFQPVPGDAE